MIFQRSMGPKNQGVTFLLVPPKDGLALEDEDMEINVFQDKIMTFFIVVVWSSNR
jgi:hypothetical protein